MGVVISANTVNQREREREGVNCCAHPYVCMLVCACVNESFTADEKTGVMAERVEVKP